MYSIEKSKGINIFGNFDYLLFLSVLILSLIGLFALRSATMIMPKNVNGDRMFIVQSISWIIGVTVAIVICTIDYKDFKNLGFILYGFSILLLLLVLFFGTSQNNSPKSWFSLPLIGSFQPSELAKIAFIIMAAYFLK